MKKIVYLSLGLGITTATLFADLKDILLKAGIKKPNIVQDAAMNNLEKVQKELKAGIPVDYKDPQTNNRSALLETARRGNLEMVRFLLDNKADINQTMAGGVTVLMLAVEGHQEPWVEVLGLPARTYGTEKTTSKYARAEHLKLVKLLIDRGANVNQQNEKGMTALFEAAGGGDNEMVQLLLDNGADPSIKNKEGDTAESYAQKKNKNPKELSARMILGRNRGS